eukprot:Selendium_serpulae@DN2058_c0_g1_i1.p1
MAQREAISDDDCTLNNIREAIRLSRMVDLDELAARLVAGDRAEASDKRAAEAESRLATLEAENEALKRQVADLKRATESAQRFNGEGGREGGGEAPDPEGTGLP